MEVEELRDLDAAKRFILEGLWLQRAVKPSAATVRPTLEWAMEVASGGHPLPPVGFIADVGHVAFGADAEHRLKDPLHVPGWPPTLARTYEDHVLGKLYADWMFERAGDALRKYQGKDRTKGLAYVLNQIRDRAGTGGVMLPPAVIRGLLASNPDDVLSQGWDSLTRDGPMELQVRLYEELAAAGRRMTDVLVKEDIDALEDRSALGDMGQYVALRQIRQTTGKIEARLPARPVRPLVGRKEVPTRVHDEDQYPVGGYTSISTRGTIESLLHSQLAFMEKESPDLFDMKFVRDELFYYSRDENQFLRRRRAFVFVLFPDLIAARFKDPELPHQRIVMLQSAILALVRRLSEWLSTDAIRFEVLFVQDGDKKPLAEEATLTQLLLREQIERGDGLVAPGDVPAGSQEAATPKAAAQKAANAATESKDAVVKYLNHLARHAQVHCLAAATEPFEMETDNAVVTELVVGGPRPEVGDGDGVVAELEGEDAFDVWQETVLRVLQLWV
jgi:vWA domain found in the FtsH ternary systems/N-terminal helical region fused to the FtsH ternary system vWA domain